MLEEDIRKIPSLEVLAVSEEVGVFAVKTENSRQFFLLGHLEYDRDTLAQEYQRDVDRGLTIQVPRHYFPGDDPTKPPWFGGVLPGADLHQLAQLLRLPDHAL